MNKKNQLIAAVNKGNATGAKHLLADPTLRLSDEVERFIDGRSQSIGLGDHVLNTATSNGDLAVLEVLCPHVGDSDQLHAPLFQAVSAGRADIVSLFLKHKVDVNGKNKLGDTALSLALKKGDQETIRALLLSKEINIPWRLLTKKYCTLMLESFCCKEDDNSVKEFSQHDEMFWARLLRKSHLSDEQRTTLLKAYISTMPEESLEYRAASGLLKGAVPNEIPKKIYKQGILGLIHQKTRSQAMIAADRKVYSFNAWAITFLVFGLPIALVTLGIQAFVRLCRKESAKGKPIGQLMFGKAAAPSDNSEGAKTNGPVA